MREAWIIDAVRTPIGRHGGGLAAVRPDDLGALTIEALLERTGIDPTTVDDVLFGCINQAGEDNRNVARMALLKAGLPVSVPGQTLNRLCGSGMQNPAFADEWTIGLGQTAEVVAEEFGVTREAQDAFAAESQRRAEAAVTAGRFDAEIVPVSIPQRKGDPVIVDRDEHPRPGTTAEALARLRPAFKKDGTVTAGNSSGINDGAAALLVVSAERGKELGLEPMARVVAGGVAGLEPHRMGMGPVPSTRIALDRAGWTVGDVDLVELNEAFAAQALPCMDQLELDPEKVNVNGGAIALGHPVGCSGARILVTLVHEMKKREAAKGLATMCVGVGQGIATLVEGI